MPNTRLTLTNNANRSQSTVVLLPLPLTLAAVLSSAKNKLRLKRASLIFAATGLPLLTPSDFESLTDGSTLFVSSGEPFVGAASESAPESGDARNDSAVVSLVANLASVEEDAMSQLRSVAKLEGMRVVVGMPDLHPGQSGPIGAVFVSQGCVFPKLIGGDIGCGMAFYSTSIDADSSPARLAKKLQGIEGAYEGSTEDWLKEREITQTEYDTSLGTIGGGNHFAELQRVVEVCDPGTFGGLGLTTGKLALLVHSGSRGLGQDVLRRTPSVSLSTSPPSDELKIYLSLHDHACSWALANRELIAHRFLLALSASATKILDVWHNNVERSTMILPPSSTSIPSDTPQRKKEEVWIHRKGAAPSDRGPLVIPGSRGTRSYLVLPTGDQEKTGRSVAHGAGRMWDRAKAREKGEGRYGRVGREALRTTKMGSTVVCDDVDLLFEEVPEAYKDIDAVVQDLVELGLVKIIAIMEPVVTYKTRSEERSSRSTD
ncbi:hypothetical protein RQP46_010531 [Phenoliferia psychrophenolica]